jgi:gamma-glutamyltranspeptidase/glutathione hydrolase
MVQTLAALGSVLTIQDFASHRGEPQTPISTGYRGTDFVEMPPNGQGLTALVMLNVLENFDLAVLDPLGPDRFHLMLEAARMAYAVRDTQIAEPSFMRVSAAALNDKAFARKLAGKIDRAKRVPLPSAPAPGGDTVYLTVVDRDRRAVSLINSLFSSFGSGICSEQTGVMFNNRGSGFVLDPAHPNALGPRKRPMHTIIPALAMRDGRCDTSFGVMGAHYQPMGHVQMALNLFDYHMDVQSAIDAPRAFFDGEFTVVERGMPVETVEGLEARGHQVVPAPSPWGGAQAIRIDWKRGVLIGGSEPRKDGCALGY